VLDANLEVRSSVAYATFAVVLVFFPILALSGVAGRLFGPLGIAYILAVLASLAVALTVTPALSMLLLTGSKRQGWSDPPVVRWSRQSTGACWVASSVSESGYRDRNALRSQEGRCCRSSAAPSAGSERRTPDPARHRHARYLARRVAAHRQADK
jgi:multidrug efflux pump subunit AcrB